MREKGSKSVRMKIDRVRCVGPSHTLLRLPLQKDNLLSSITVKLFFSSFFNILRRVRRGAQCQIAIVRRGKRWRKLLNIDSEHKRPPGGTTSRLRAAPQVRHVLPAGC